MALTSEGVHPTLCLVQANRTVLLRAPRPTGSQAVTPVPPGSTLPWTHTKSKPRWGGLKRRATTCDCTAPSPMASRWVSECVHMLVCASPHVPHGLLMTSPNSSALVPQACFTCAHGMCMNSHSACASPRYHSRQEGFGIPNRGNSGVWYHKPGSVGRGQVRILYDIQSAQLVLQG